MYDYELNEQVPLNTSSAEAVSLEQEQLFELYLEQQRRLCCPSCGDDGFIE